MEEPSDAATEEPRNIWVGRGGAWRCVEHDERWCKSCRKVVKPPAWPRTGQFVRSDGSRVSVEAPSDAVMDERSDAAIEEPNDDSTEEPRNVWVSNRGTWRCIEHDERLCKSCRNVVKPPVVVRMGQIVRSDGSRVSVDDVREIATEEPMGIATEEPMGIATEEPMEVATEESRNVWVCSDNAWWCVEHGERRCKTCLNVVKPPAFPRTGQFVRSDGSRVSVDDGDWWNGLSHVKEYRVSLVQGGEKLRHRNTLSIAREGSDLGLSLSGKEKMFVSFRAVTDLVMTEAPVHLWQSMGKDSLPSSYRSGYASTSATAALFGVPPGFTMATKAVRRHNQKQRALLSQAQGGSAPPVVLAVVAGDESWTFHPQDPGSFIAKFGPMVQAWIESHPEDEVSDETPVSVTGTAMVADELRKLADLRDAGILTPEEFEARKSRLLDTT